MGILRIYKCTTVNIINCHAPKLTATDGEKDDFYKEMEEVTKNERSYHKTVVGASNAIIHEERPDIPRTGPLRIGEANGNGERMIDR
ncbi:unnamed protein product [Haemonchus placei]|uniref:Uncharacterized protein n=1 Tax=Haemonchus placei TaxID=6290 RepID=A0A0N4WIZ2_HAEPC|nr:unnamed protein product [Haemonchus placei]